MCIKMCRNGQKNLARAMQLFFDKQTGRNGRMEGGGGWLTTPSLTTRPGLILILWIKVGATFN